MIGSEISRHAGMLFEYLKVFTGGAGAGSADLTAAEGIVFRDVLRNEHPEIAESDIMIESKSTNTGENISMSAAVLEEWDASFSFKQGIASVIAVASPYRQRRVWRTLQKHLPHVKVINMPPKTTFEREIQLFEQKGEDFIELLIGEVGHIMSYPAKGYI